MALADRAQKLLERLENDFSYHSLSDSQKERNIRLRAEAKQLAKNFIIDCPDSRELSLALTKLEESVYWATESIARNE